VVEVGSQIGPPEARGFRVRCPEAKENFGYSRETMTSNRTGLEWSARLPRQASQAARKPTLSGAQHDRDSGGDFFCHAPYALWDNSQLALLTTSSWDWHGGASHSQLFGCSIGVLNPGLPRES